MRLRVTGNGSFRGSAEKILDGKGYWNLQMNGVYCDGNDKRRRWKTWEEGSEE